MPAKSLNLNHDGKASTWAVRPSNSIRPPSMQSANEAIPIRTLWMGIVSVFTNRSTSNPGSWIQPEGVQRSAKISGLGNREELTVNLRAFIRHSLQVLD